MSWLRQPSPVFPHLVFALVITLIASLGWLLHSTLELFYLVTVSVLLLIPAWLALAFYNRKRWLAVEQLREITDSIPAVIYQAWRRPDGDSGFAFVSAGIRQLLGIEPDQAATDPTRVFERVIPEDHGRLQAAIEQSAENLTPFSLEFRVRHIEGGTRWVRASSLPRRESDGTVIWNGYWLDITGQKESQRAVSFSEQLRQMAVEVSQLGAWSLEVETGKVDWSARCAEIFGFDAGDEISFERAMRRIHPDDRPQVEKAVEEALENRTEYRADYRVILPDGRIAWVAATGRVFYGSDGQPAHLEGVVLDISEHKSIEQQMATSLALLSTQQELSPDGIVARDPEFGLISYNRRFSEMWNLDREILDSGDSEAILTHMRNQLADPHNFAARVADLKQQLAGKAHQELQLIDGRILEEHSAPMNDASGNELGRVWYYRDISHRKEREQALREAKEAAEAANRAKSSFLATMSHEIRTPMNGVLGMLELLGLSDLDTEQRTSLQVIRESTRSLQRLIDDILDLSKIEADKLEIHPEVTSIGTVIDDMRALYSGAALSRGLGFECITDPDLPPAVRVDSLRLKQILNNLISNALKFTAEGTIRVRAELGWHDDNLEWVRFSVADTGIGIAPEHQAALFQPFTQADDSITRHFGGTGLGLTICKRLTDLMGGTIEMDSAPGRGTTVTVTLPLETADPAELRNDHQPESADPVSSVVADRRPPPGIEQAEKEGTLVLVVDDHPTNRLVLLRQLNALGYAAETAEDGEQALALWKSGRYALLLVDCNMPRMDGFELTRTIRKLENAEDRPATPLIAWTANALRGDAEACFVAGMDDYLSKPAELLELMEKLDFWLPITGDETTRTGPSAPRGSAWPVDRSVLAALAGDDRFMIREIFKDFRRTNESDASSLQQAVAATDAEQVRSVAHRIKGASKMVGAVRLAEVSEKLEQAASAGAWEVIRASLPVFQRERGKLNAYIQEL